MLTAVVTETVYDQFAAQAERTPYAVAITAPDRAPLTYAQLLSQIENVKKSLNACGLGRNDRVVIVHDNGPEMAVAFMAIASCCTAVPLNPAGRLYVSQERFEQSALAAAVGTDQRNDFTR